MSEVQCEFCGELFHKQGIGAHKRHCDAKMGESSFTGIEQDVFERDNGQCVRCESAESLTIHTIHPDIDAKKSNLATVCATCDDELASLHHRTKRTKIRSD